MIAVTESILFMNGTLMKMEQTFIDHDWEEISFFFYWVA